MNEVSITLLNPKHHERKAFNCGVSALNDYLQAKARQHSDKDLSRTYVAIKESEPSRILGFVTLALCEIHADELPQNYAKRYPRKVQGIRLGRLAVSLECQRMGIGSALMFYAMTQAANVSKQAGGIGLFVD